MKTRKKKREHAGIPPEFRGDRGRFLPGNPGGPGRPPLFIDLENLRAITSVLTPEAWKDLAQRKLEAAKKGDREAFEWCERRGLGDVTLSELKKAENGAGEGEDVDRRKDLLALDEEVLREELVRFLQKARMGPLTAEESERVLEIRRVLNEAKSVEKLPDFSDLEPRQAEDELFRMKEGKRGL